MKTNVGVTIAILNANNQVVNNRHARAITKELLVCRLCIILLSLYELMVEINIIHLALFQLGLFVSLMRLSYQRKIKEMKMWSEQVAGMGRERQKNFLEYCQRMIRENFIFNLHQRNLTYMTINEQNFATRFAPFVNERNVMGIMDELSEAQLHIEQNVNAKMVFFDFSLKMIVLLKQ